jgi:2-oxoglutarate dehydrogenase complex, dehydrogenase (E1) component, and related enzymes
LIHGDASFAGQGVIYETMQLMNLPSYSTGGTLHLVVNNQIGYTTAAKESRSTCYCTDIAKTFGSPVFHVNAEDPESCLLVAGLAADIRQKFQCDVFIDLLCYRKYGHNEGDEPSYTQPLEYKLIRSKQSIRDLYTAKLIEEGAITQGKVETFEEQYKNLLAQSLESIKNTPFKKAAVSSPAHLLEPFATGVDQKTLQQIASVYCQPPSEFHVHPKLEKWLQDRLASVMGDPAKPSIDWATAECLAFGSLLLQNVSIRLAGEDSQRGTFSQRHLVLIDAETGKPDSPLTRLKAGQGRLDVVNTPLTEYAGMAFEYGYSWSDPQALVLWEAQYGDFNNGAQIIIDQYLASAEHKWGTPSSLTLLLPHAYEGAGPEHSSARLERFLQLTAEDNMQIVNASTPAQYFHLLRRQSLRSSKKPLIVFTPKSLLRSPLNVSSLNELMKGSFQEILDDPVSPSSCKKILFCSGKIYYELRTEREKRKIQDIALVRIEQFYPLHHQKLQEIANKYKEALEWLWVQEESENAGAWSFMKTHLLEHKPRDVSLFYVGRSANPTTATGSHRKHKQEQQDLLDRALRS